MTVVTTPTSDTAAELRRQAGVLVGKGYPAAAGMTAAQFLGLVEALVDPLAERAAAADEPFVLVVTRGLVPPVRQVELTELRGKRGFTTMDSDDLERFEPTEHAQVPRTSVYLIVDADTGGDTRGVRPDDALPGILAAGRTPLTVEEGLAVVTQHPEWLRERNCFEMLGSRAGDKRVTGLWLSKGAPRLGWCWGGNPHTWLGMASAAARLG